MNAIEAASRALSEQQAKAGASGAGSVYNAPVTIDKAHSVRALCACHYCGGIGSKDSTIKRNDVHYHGRCFVERFGIHALLCLPTEQTDRLMLCDIGPETMRALLDARPSSSVSESKR